MTALIIPKLNDLLTSIYNLILKPEYKTYSIKKKKGDLIIHKKEGDICLVNEKYLKKYSLFKFN